MESQRQDEVSDEDIPSDFFDDFSKDEFMEGLSVIDSWDVEEGVQRRSSRTRIDSATVDGVRDLRELIRDGRDEMEIHHDEKYTSRYKKRRYEHDVPYEMHSKDTQRDSSSSRLDSYIKPGSRRDLRKTNEAIKKDKQVKVKEYLSKHLESIDALKPPGTELDDFLNESTTSTKRRNRSNSTEIHTPQYSSKEIMHRESPRKHYQVREERNIHHSPQHYNNNSQPHGAHYGPQHKSRHYSPNWRTRRYYSPSYISRRSSRPRRSPVQYSPPRYNPARHSPARRSPARHIPARRSSSRRSTTHQYRGRHSQSPVTYSHIEKRSSATSKEFKDTFLYPNEPCQTSNQAPNLAPYQTEPGEFYLNPPVSEYPGVAPGYSYTQQGQPYPVYNAPYEFGAQTDSLNLGMTQPVSTPIMNSGPVMVPPPHQSTSVVPSTSITNPLMPQEKPLDALAKLVVEGKISKEDYLKLAPNKGTLTDKAADTQVRVKVLNRCHEALTKLSKLALPNRLLINNALIGQEAKSIAPKYCSPLKRQATVDFYFTKTNGKAETVQHNKQLIDGIISTIGLNDIVSRSKKKNRKGMKDAAVQTTKSFCDVCQIRDSTKTYEVGTSIDLEDFTSTVHTQVVDEDLISSRAIFNPSGSISDSAPVSIAHLTPAQLVSQLAARAKTLKQNEATQQSQFNRWNPGNSFDYDGRGNGNQYNYNYRF